MKVPPTSTPMRHPQFRSEIPRLPSLRQDTAGCRRARLYTGSRQACCRRCPSSAWRTETVCSGSRATRCPGRPRRPRAPRRLVREFAPGVRPARDCQKTVMTPNRRCQRARAPGRYRRARDRHAHRPGNGRPVPAGLAEHPAPGGSAFRPPVDHRRGLEPGVTPCSSFFPVFTGASRNSGFRPSSRVLISCKDLMVRCRIDKD